MPDPALTVNVADVRGDEAGALIAELDELLLTLYPPASVKGLSESEMAGGGQVTFVVARLGGEAVGCGALRQMEGGAGEVKRMFTRPSARRRGVGRAVLERLQVLALERGLQVLRLETGTLQTDSHRLYEALGFARVDCWGKYASDPWSLCYEKRLGE